MTTAPGAAQAAVDLARAHLSRFLVVHAQRKRMTGGSAFGPSSEEVVRTLSPANVTPAAEIALHNAKVAAAEAELDAALAATPEPLLARLRRGFSLSRLDLTIIAILLAPELDHELERAYTFAVDDFTRKRGDVGFITRLVGAGDPTTADLALTRFDDGAPLRRHGVVVLTAAGDAAATMRAARLTDRIASFLRGHDTIDDLVRGFVHQTVPPAVSDIIMPQERIDQITRALDPRRGPARLLLAGPEGAGRAFAVEAILAASGRRSLRVDLAGIVAEGKITERIAAALREGALRDAAIILEGGASVKDDVPRALVNAITEGTDGLAVPIIVTLLGRPAWLAQAVPELIEIDIPAPTFRERVALWTRALPPPLADAADLETVAARYGFTGATIARAARRSAATARLREPDGPKVTLDDLGDAARLMFSHRLGGMAQRIPTGFRWDDLVLQKETLESVREVTRFARFRPFLLEDWGFASKLPYGRGVSAILAGPPGTGKTMVAQLLAKELGYDLYRIDLSQVVNKYIGETEKNLAKIFDEAESSHAVLFFDEADSLFAKRTDVKSSNDRYANLEVNYLLQRMETYDGVTLLATNLEQGIDEAFKRRVRFSIMFELPEEDERRKLWVSMFPKQVPLEPNIDWDTIAKRFEMAGGYIKKAALRAALIAAEANRAISTNDILEAARQEYREMGRII